jgi:septal ring factor EnvC (AmiA/AmiB activator)
MLRLSEAGISDANYNEALAAGLLNLAAQYDNTTQEVNAYYAAIATGKDSTKALNELAIAVKSAEQAAANGLEADDVEELARAFQKMGKAGQEGYESLADDAEAATDAAVRYKRLNNAVEDLADNYDDYADALKDIRKASTSSDKALAAQTSTAKSLKTSLAGLLDTSEDLIDADFMSSIDPDDL